VNALSIKKYIFILIKRIQMNVLSVIRVPNNYINILLQVIFSHYMIILNKFVFIV